MFLPVRATVYVFNPRNWFNSWKRVKHDTSNALGEIVGISAKPYSGPIEVSRLSKSLGIEAEVRNGKLMFSAPRFLMGDLPNLSQKKVNEIEERYKVIVNRGGNSIDYRLNVEEIIEEVKSKNKGLSKVRDLAIEKIAETVDYKLRGVAKIAGGTFAHYDSELMKGIGRKLYEDYESSNPRTIIDNASAVPRMTKQGSFS